jgi:hypothetical protein
MNGYGTYKFKSGAVYMGEWFNGKAEGRVFYLRVLAGNGFLGYRYFDLLGLLRLMGWSVY